MTAAGFGRLLDAAVRSRPTAAVNRAPPRPPAGGRDGRHHGFKAVNDRHGHEVGDQVLVATAEALQRALRAEDVIGRLGGEEFLALLPDTPAEAAARAAERLRAAVAGAGGRVPVTASVGWADLRAGEQPDDLVRRADEALYAAKAEGRDRVRGPATLPRRT